jgi:bacteriocin biosynthesis cyclodehydratase domain-containing protein
MASAIRMTKPEHGLITLAGSGPFGRRVVSLIEPAHPGGRQADATPAGITAAFTEPARAVVIALWRPDPELCDIADDLAYAHQRPWLPVIAEHPVIRIGPLVRPPAGPCFRCYARRRRQHDQQPWVTAALQATYGQEPGCGPAGYLPHHARLAAAVAADMLRRLKDDPAAPADDDPGDVATLRLSHMGLLIGLRSSRVVSCHDCGRCGTAERPGASAWLTDLVLRMGRIPARWIGTAS